MICCIDIQGETRSETHVKPQKSTFFAFRNRQGLNGFRA